MAIISSAWQIPPGPSHYSLTSQVSELVAKAVQEYGTGPHIPGLMLSCSKELMQVQSMTPQVWPNWHSIGYDDPCLLRHPWCSQIVTWEELGDDTFDLLVTAPPSIGLIPVDLPSPPIVTSNVTGSSTNTTTESQDKGKGKAVVADLEPKADRSRKRKLPMMSALSSQPPKLVMKTQKRAKSTCVVKSRPFVESEDEEDLIIKLLSGGVLEVILPWLSTIYVRKPQLLRSPQVPTKKPFSPATVIAASCLAIIKPTPPKSNTPPVIKAGDILIPGPVKQPMPGLQQARLALCNSVGQEDWQPLHVVCLLHDQEDQVYLCNSGIPAEMLLRTPSKAPSKAPSALQLKPQTHSQSRGQSSTPDVTAMTTPKTEMHGRSKTITAIKAPAPAPAAILSSGSAVPAAALDMPMPDLHAMAMAIREGAAQITILEARVAEQDGKMDTLQCLHESLQRKIVDQHPSFPLPDPPAKATSMLLNQPIPMSMSPPESTLPPLIHLLMAEMAPTPPKFEDASAIEGLLFEYSQVQQEDTPTSSKNVDPGDPGNLVPEYDSFDDMDVEVQVEASGEEVDMAT
ncbi:hypothetical protein EDB19DRAFT_1918363 [Suillus lakei]|nr:hypothetical protein EDB19DRAFT_1918363 [Suillus lakei]